MEPTGTVTQPPSAIRIFDDLDAARDTILQRTPLAAATVPSHVAAGIEEIFGAPLTPQQVVGRILADVRDRGDAAVHEYTHRIDGVELSDLVVTKSELEAAWETTSPELRDALQLAADRIRTFHLGERHPSWITADAGAPHTGTVETVVTHAAATAGPEREVLGQLVRPLERVGIYVPGGTAPLPSSLLMAAVPAQVAGVETITVCTPPTAGGGANAVVLSACRLLGIDRVFKIGGAQAIAAMAFGTDTVPAVDKIVGPGNLFVILAKKAVFGEVDIESLPGPTETLLIADDSANAAWVAADLLAQSEHIMGTSILLTPSADLAQATQQEVDRQLPELKWRAEIAAALLANGGIGIVHDLDEAVDAANAYAPEHLCLLTRDPWSLVPRLHNAGGIFVGDASSEALGDYVAGPSHIMPTGGTARFASPLHLRDFLKVTSIIGVGLSAHNRTAAAAARIAEAESLTAHASALRHRLQAQSGDAEAEIAPRPPGETKA